jgi:N-methylhydantoinase B
VLEGPLEVTHRGDRHFSRPWGLKGGKPAMSWSTVLKRIDGSEHKVPARERFKMQTGDMLTCITAGGGGYSDPLLRPAAQVAEDVVDGRVSREAADRDYGVVLDTAFKLDAAATESRRHVLAAERGDITWTFDRGEGGRA